MKSHVLKISSLDDNYKIEINVYPEPIESVDSISDTISSIDEELSKDVPDTTRVAYLAFYPFRNF